MADFTVPIATNLLGSPEAKARELGLISDKGTGDE
jgi:hypothetical protein